MLEGETPLWIITGLGAALCACAGALLKFIVGRRRQLAAQSALAALASSLSAGSPATWRLTGDSAIDDIAEKLESFDKRLRSKREKLFELNKVLLGSGVSESALPSMMRAVIEAMPIGVIIAEAPSGRILEGNKVMEEICGHPILYSESTERYRDWHGQHADGRQVQPEEYPLARALQGEERPTLECRYQRDDGVLRWISIVGAPIRDANDKIIAAILAVTDIDDVKMAEVQRHVMNKELHHRVNNALAMIQGVANITARTATDFSSFRDDFSERIQSLSRLSTLLVQSSWERTPLRDIIEVTLGDLYAPSQRRLSIEGDDVALRSEVALAIGMILYELRANAERFGALSSESGQVALSWRLDDAEPRRLEMTWAESGGPPVVKPARRGVGHYLMKALSKQMGGAVEAQFDPAGVRALIRAEI